jgi:hypothetical protein
VLTSIGKKVITTTTAALDCQSKPNHMTMIGATPTIGSADQIADRDDALAQERAAVDQDRGDETDAAAHHVTGDHRLEIGLLEIRPEDVVELRIRPQIMDGAGSSTLGTLKPRVTPSHSAIRAAPKSTGMRMLMMRLRQSGLPA